MGSPLNEYNYELSKRIMALKEDKRLSYEELAEFMGCDARHASKVANGKAKATGEDIANLSQNLPMDPDYLLLGKREMITRLAQFWAGANENQLAELHMEMAKSFSTRASILQRNQNPKPDFIVGKDTLVETHKRRK